MIDDTIIAIAGKLKTIRISKGLTQADIANKAGLNTNYYAKVERAEAAITIRTLRKAVEALEVKSSDVLPF